MQLGTGFLMRGTSEIIAIRGYKETGEDRYEPTAFLANRLKWAGLATTHYLGFSRPAKESK